MRKMHAVGAVVACAPVAACAATAPRSDLDPRSASPARFEVSDSPAQLFAPSIISDRREQWRITFSRDGKTAYFAASDGFFPITRSASIYVTRYRTGRWSTPQLAPFSGRFPDMDPALSPDGRRLYFTSIRPVAGTPRVDTDPWYVDRTPAGWSEPIHLGPEINTEDDELYASVDDAGTLYFASGPMRPQHAMHFDIYRARPDGTGFTPRVALPATINRKPTPGGGCRTPGISTRKFRATAAP